MATTGPAAIARIQSIPKEAFFKTYVARSQPVVITDIAASWPARQLWSVDYFQRQYGDETVALCRTSRGVLSHEPDEGIPEQFVSVTTALTQVFSNKEADRGYYLIASLDKYLRGLTGEIQQPEYTRGSPMTGCVYISRANTKTPLHRDFPGNFLVQVVGRKCVSLVPPDEGHRVYPFSRNSRLPTWTPVDLEYPDYDRFPRLKDVRPLTVVIEPGEGLFIPSRWWHEVRSLDDSFSVNFWWPNGMVRVFELVKKLYQMFRR